MSCCGPTRRTLLGAMAVATLSSALGAGASRAQRNSLIATDLELVTVTDRSVIMTWTTVAPDASGQPVPVASSGAVRVAPVGSAPVTMYESAEPTPFHYAEITGLEPGRRYIFEAESEGVRAVSALNPVTLAPDAPEVCGEFTTLVPPPGRLLRTFALGNDVHYGETVSGLIVGDFPPGFRSLPDLPPYPEVMLAALLDDLRAPDRGAQRLILAGDLTAEATPSQSRSVRAQLDSWGALGRDYLVARGNHDRPHTGADYASCAPATADHRDCFTEFFVPREELVQHEIGGLRLLGLDTSELDGTGGRIDRPQFDHLTGILTADPDRPTLIFGHHPVTRTSGATALAGPGFILNASDSTELQTLYTRAPGVFLHHAGHTHRNLRTRPDTPCDVEFLEVASVKEYPGGYTLLRIHEGGYMVSFYKTRTPAARQWSALTRNEYFGLIPAYTLGHLTDRNHVVHRDFSGLT
ncbi:metallophosphoesterase [Nocardia bovistercoris]|uniref:Metallophosphoesterase n=1 Tax=Nocardia bovistercoris TaxID=2785916 RepID=A0A931ICL0_9NOCA|nr:metallophosphoesterase [Nocardia bovistercoris]MBH0777370.1 metallophosphoesterase [Nocardia bovistercoris]